ncbi:GTP 3',8-cyclase MoaA [Megalodesulfovibrio paquesii]
MTTLPNTATPQGTPLQSRLVDDHGRSINYLRLSLTDRCNFRCKYCRGGPVAPLIPHEDVLRYEELLELISIVSELGVRKIRLTGGEPLLRRDFVWFLDAIRIRSAQLGAPLDVRITTNGSRLARMADDLARLGVKWVNVSLDSLNPQTFRDITGVDCLEEVRRGIDACLERGIRIKINAVAMAGTSEAELPGFIDFAKATGSEVRFIEFMPMGENSQWSEANYLPSRVLLDQARELVTLTALDRVDAGGGPAKVFQIDNGPARLGFISPMSSHFCGSCNRLRITSDGRLRTCLFSDKEYRLRPALRHPRLGLPVVKRIIELAQRSKPLGYEILQARQMLQSVARKQMSAIGG